MGRISKPKAERSRGIGSLGTSLPLVYLERIPQEAAGYILPSSATIKGLVLQNLSSAGTDMALKCDLCGKGPHYGNVVSHANNTRRRRWNPNLKRVRAIVSGVHKHLRVCTACIRAGKVTKAGASRAPKAA